MPKISSKLHHFLKVGIILAMKKKLPKKKCNKMFIKYLVA
jgi:hypothetical protein